MAVKYRNDVTDYITPFDARARLVATLAPSSHDGYANHREYREEWNP